MGCATGEFGTLFLMYKLGYQDILTTTYHGPLLPLSNGIATSLLFETIVLHRTSQMPLAPAFKTALGMSFSSMLAMEIAMGATDYCITGRVYILYTCNFQHCELLVYVIIKTF